MTASRTRRTGALLLLIAVVSGAVFAQDALFRRQNIGLILDTPFLHQTSNPVASEFYGAYGGEAVSYEFNADGLPVFVRYADIETGLPFVDMEASYRPDGHIDQAVYLSYDEDGAEIVFRDEFTFTDYGENGPRTGYLITNDGGSAEMRLTYDSSGRIIAIEEDDAYGDGLFRSERYLWTSPDQSPALPYALEVYYVFDAEVERYFYHYDANDRLHALQGENTPIASPLDLAFVSEHYIYEEETLDDLFGPIEEIGGGQTALR